MHCMVLSVNGRYSTPSFASSGINGIQRQWRIASSTRTRENKEHKKILGYVYGHSIERRAKKQYHTGTLTQPYHLSQVKNVIYDVFLTLLKC